MRSLENKEWKITIEEERREEGRGIEEEKKIPELIIPTNKIVTLTREEVFSTAGG